jgi:hypothetical protein
MQAGLSRLLQQRAGLQQRAEAQLPRASAVLLAAPMRAGSLSEHQALEASQQAAGCLQRAQPQTRPAPASAVSRLDPLLQQAPLDSKQPLARLQELRSVCLPLERDSCEEKPPPGLVGQPQGLLAAGGPGPVAESTQADSDAIEQQGAASSGKEEPGSGTAPEPARSLAPSPRGDVEQPLRSRSPGTLGLGRTLRSSSATSSGWSSSIGGRSCRSSDAGDSDSDSDYPVEDEAVGSSYEGEEGGQGARPRKLQQPRSHRQLSLLHRAGGWPACAKRWLLVR